MRDDEDEDRRRQTMGEDRCWVVAGELGTREIVQPGHRGTGPRLRLDNGHETRDLQTWLSSLYS
ncbi:MAG: hypothetical protein JSW51_08560 [Gemmatimonadota bacterium]|nr:MAG: hypothetical protein JSW51_08560 [Gemmatimonadota bacterium]